jgi:hypothetical protein
MSEKANSHIDHYQDHFNPIQVSELAGTLILGALAFALLLAFLRQVSLNLKLTTLLLSHSSGKRGLEQTVA